MVNTGAAGPANGGGPGAGGGPSGGAGGAGGAGGVGGQGVGGGTSAEDWLGSFGAVFRFEGTPLGENSGSATNLVLSETGSPQANPDAREGASSAWLTTSDALTSSDTMFALVGNTFTIGAWVREQGGAPHEESTVLAKSNFSTQGYRLGRTPNQSLALRCGSYDGGELDFVDSAVGSFGENAWVHVACVFTDTEIIALVNGSVSATTPAQTISHADAAFQIGGTDFAGLVDEAFVINAALTEEAIARIRACGIDGSGCTCNGAEYVNCGHASSDGCMNLQDCDDTAPMLLSP